MDIQRHSERESLQQLRGDNLEAERQDQEGSKSKYVQLEALRLGLCERHSNRFNAGWSLWRPARYMFLLSTRASRT
jgi:hypothetical protein